MLQELKQALDTLLDVQDSSGLNRKRELLESHKSNQTLQDILYFVYNPYIRTGIGHAKLNKVNASDDTAWLDDKCTFQGMCTYLLHNNTGRDTDVSYIKHYISLQEPRFEKILADIFTKTLKLGVSTTTFNKIWPNLIPGFGVMLACRWQDNLEYLKNKHVFVTEKLDGNRCFTKVQYGKVEMYSRSGKPIEGCEDIEKEMSLLPNGWYDGELIGQDFQETQSKARKKGSKTGLVFNVFDFLTIMEVETQCCIHEYGRRRNHLDNVIGRTIEDNNMQWVKVVPLICEFFEWDDKAVKTTQDILDQYTSNGSEGLMLNIDAMYQFNRTIDILKVKKMYTVDLRVKGIHEGNGENQGKVGALIVDYKGYNVGVGSGLSLAQRDYWFEHPEEIIDKIIEVKCFEETKDKQGNLSLRFPVFVRVRDDKEEPSYE